MRTAIPIETLEALANYERRVPIEFGRMRKDALLFVSIRLQDGPTLRLSCVHNREKLDVDRVIPWDMLSNSIAGPEWVIRQTVRDMKERMRRSLLVH